MQLDSYANIVLVLFTIKCQVLPMNLFIDYELLSHRMKCVTANIELKLFTSKCQVLPWNPFTDYELLRQGMKCVIRTQSG